MPTSLLVAAGSAAVSYGANKLFSSLDSPSSPKVGYTPTGFNAGGLNATFGPGGYSVTPSGERRAAVGNIANTFGAQASQIDEALGRVRPGVGDLRSSRLAEIENARQASIGNLRENLGRRRVLGSSFAQDAVTRTEAEFAQARERTQAESFLQEMEMTQRLHQEQFAARRAQFQTGLDELNLEANLAAKLSSAATDVLAKNAQVEAMLGAQAMQGAGRFFGQLAQPVGAAAGKSIAGMDFGSWWKDPGGATGSPAGLPTQA